MARLEPPFAPGIYFGLPEEKYHADKWALGSSSLKTLALNPAAFSYEIINPDQVPDSETHSKFIGRCVHQTVLEGRGRLDRLVAPEPESSLRTMDDLRNWITENGRTPRGTRKRGLIGQVIELAHELGVETPMIYDIFKDGCDERGVVPIKQEDYERIVFASANIASNPALKEAFVDGDAEVSVFWEHMHNGQKVRRKMRVDYLKPRALVDLKSMRPMGLRPFPDECRRAIANWRYDIQMESYLDGRAAMETLFREGKVIGANRYQAERLARVMEIPAQAVAFVFVFWASAGPPLVWGGQISPTNPMREIARGWVDRALDNFAQCMKRFGRKKLWLDEAILEEVFVDDMPTWFAR